MEGELSVHVVTWDPGGPWLSIMEIEIVAPGQLGYHVHTRRRLAGLPLPHDSLFRRHRGTAVRVQVKERPTVAYDGLLSIHFSFIVTSWLSYGKIHSYPRNPQPIRVLSLGPSS